MNDGAKTGDIVESSCVRFKIIEHHFGELWRFYAEVGEGAFDDFHSCFSSAQSV